MTLVDVAMRASKGTACLLTASLAGAGNDARCIVLSHVSRAALKHTAGSVAAGIRAETFDACQIFLLVHASGALKHAASRLTTLACAVSYHLRRAGNGIVTSRTCERRAWRWFAVNVFGRAEGSLRI